MSGPASRPVENGERNIDLPLTWDDIARWITENSSTPRAYLTGSEAGQVAPSAAHRAGYDAAMKTLAAKGAAS